MTRPTPVQLGTWVVLVLVSWLIGDVLGAVFAILGVGAVSAGFPARRLPLVGVGLVGSAAIAWLVGNAGRWGIVSFDLVTRNPWPGRFGLVAVVLLMVGVALDLVPSRTAGREDADDRT